MTSYTVTVITDMKVEAFDREGAEAIAKAAILNPADNPVEITEVWVDDVSEN